MAKVRPTGDPPMLEAHQPPAIRMPAATPVAGQGHLRCWGSPGAFAIQIAPAMASSPMTSQGETPKMLARVGGAPPPGMAGGLGEGGTRAGAPSPAAGGARGKARKEIPT